MRRAHDAVAEIQRSGTMGYQWVLDADIEACFDTISHAALTDRLRVRVKDKRVWRAVWPMLQYNPVMVAKYKAMTADTGAAAGTGRDRNGLQQVTAAARARRAKARVACAASLLSWIYHLVVPVASDIERATLAVLPTLLPRPDGTPPAGFVIDVYSRRILGWRASTSKPTALVLDPLEQALFTRRRNDSVTSPG